jgi:hypothetical protein
MVFQAVEEAMAQEPAVEQAIVSQDTPVPMMVDEPQTATPGPQKRKAEDEGVMEPSHKRTRAGIVIGIQPKELS